MVRVQVTGPEREVEGLERIWSQAALTPLHMKKQRPRGGDTYRPQSVHGSQVCSPTCTQSPCVTATQLPLPHVLFFPQSCHPSHLPL